ncbi:hypothetical protein FD754_003520 [Muntiacus muntjak]|uniref:40S ribosomal protein S3a n=1 Tax=Muntiacus muntjak TaxID=9888 RepID=A0A5N3WD14_MUNMU|nr:hypothetical protein FD754_003520 [Muntiacus muntjak]
MVVGKNKHLMKGGKRGAKKKVVDPFSKKDGYDVKAPVMFNIKNIGKTLVRRSQGTKIASDDLKRHVFEVSLDDLHNDEVAFRKPKLIIEDTMIKAHVVVKITNGYLLHLFCMGFNKKKCSNQIQMTSYVQTNDLKELVNKLIPDSLGKDIEKSCQSIYLLHDVFIRKEKMLKKPKFALGKLMELHGEVTGAKGERDDGYKPPVQESV